MTEIIDYQRLKTLVEEIFWKTVPISRGLAFKGSLSDDLGMDSLEAFDLAAEFHFRFDMMSGGSERYLLQYKSADQWMEQIYEAANDPNSRLGFFSSGSRGAPKTNMA